ncbi:MAG TPA: hypothetical protein GX724_04490 [Fibrobacter sp.]|nr:hypothetical protein [Fibrobacter sp.]
MKKYNLRTGFSTALVLLFLALSPIPVSAHCDSYDGPTIKDALKALETNNVNLALKWIDKGQEPEVVSLFNQANKLKNGDKETYAIVKKYFLETIVRLHRETEGAPYTGLKEAGSTKAIVQLSDNALAKKDIKSLLEKLNKHIGTIIQKKYEKVVTLEKEKNISAEKGREYVAAYVDYTHSIEALHDILEGGGGHKH